MLGLHAPLETVDALFDSFDLDGSGTIGFKELNRHRNMPSYLAITARRLSAIPMWHPVRASGCGIPMWHPDEAHLRHPDRASR